MKAGDRAKLIAAGRRDLVEIHDINASGYAGCLPNGNIVDRRKHPEAVPVQRNGLFNIPPPKKLVPMYKFAKLFEVTAPGSDPLHQVLVVRKTDDEGKPVVAITCKFPSVTPTMVLGFEDVETRDNAFEKYNEDSAEKFVNDCITGLNITE